MATTLLLSRLTTSLASATRSDASHAVTNGPMSSSTGPFSSTTSTMMTTMSLTAMTTTTMPRAQPPPDYLVQAQFVCDQVLIPMLVTFGIVGNLLSLVVLTRKEMASPTNCFLTALAISDISLLLLHLPTFFRFNQRIATSHSYQLFVRYYTVILYVMTNVFLTCTCWLTVAVTVERFLSLRFMMHPRLVCSLPRAKRAILAVFFASFLLHFSKFFEYVPNLDLRSPMPVLPTQLSLNKAYDTAMHISNITLTALLPIAALIVFNSFLIYFLATHRRRMLKYKSKTKSKPGPAGSAVVGGSKAAGEGGRASSVSVGNNNNNNNNTKSNSATSVDMLHVSAVVVAVVLVFVVCHSLGVFLALNIAVHGRHRVFSGPLFLALKHVNGLLVMLNSSVNFLVYCSISRKFRTMFTSIFQRWFSLSRSGAGAGSGPGKASRPWCLPLPVLGGDNSLGNGVVLRTGGHPANGYTVGPTREASFVRASPTNSSGTKSLDNTLDLP